MFYGLQRTSLQRVCGDSLSRGRRAGQDCEVIKCCRHWLSHAGDRRPQRPRAPRARRRTHSGPGARRTPGHFLLSPPWAHRWGTASQAQGTLLSTAWAAPGCCAHRKWASNLSAALQRGHEGSVTGGGVRPPPTPRCRTRGLSPRTGSLSPRDSLCGRSDNTKSVRRVAGPFFLSA